MEFSDGLLLQEVGVKKLKEKWGCGSRCKGGQSKSCPRLSESTSHPQHAQSTRCTSSSPSPAQSTRCSSSSPQSPPSRPDAAAAAPPVPTPHPQVEPPQATPTPDPSRFPGSPGLPVTPGAHWRPPANAPARVHSAAAALCASFS